MRVPSLQEAEALLSEAKRRNSGPWVQHSIYVAKAAEAIASYHPELDPTTALILGYLHDIGRQEGVTDMRHALDGYTILNERGFSDAAQICLTHSFPMAEQRRAETAAGTWDCSAEELAFVDSYLEAVAYSDYDRLLQLCDCLAVASGFCLIEKRFVDVVTRHGFNEHTIPRWKAYLGLQESFESAIGRSIYSILPGVVENTFGFSQEEPG
ncbi:HD domain-containing protein [soil metagenome]|jgi:putative nucleotidyltransferase with HDIG domain|nr:HD domain-containing protein [Deinococcota bacterium]